jgi:hypothetical protein
MKRISAIVFALGLFCGILADDYTTGPIPTIKEFMTLEKGIYIKCVDGQRYQCYYEDGNSSEDVKLNLSALMWAISNGYSDKIVLYCTNPTVDPALFSRVKILMD